MTTKLDALNNFHAKLLLDVGVFDATGEGLLSYNDGSGPTPVTITKKRLCLPTKKLLKEGDWELRIPFHPLSEQINQGPSPVLNAFKGFVHHRLTVTIKRLAVELMKLAAEPKRHKGLGEKPSELLKIIIGADEKTVSTLEKVLAQVSDTPEKRILTLFLKNGGEGGALRTCVVTFPILDEAHTENTEEFFGVKMPRKTKDKDLIVKLLEFILGDEDVRKLYTQASSNRDAPYFHSLLASFNKLASRLKDLIGIYSKSCEELKPYQFNLDWVEEFNDFDDFARICGAAAPPLPGNRGKERDEEEVKTTNAFVVDEDDVGQVDEKEPEKPKRSWRDLDRDEEEERERERERSRDRERERDRDRDYDRRERDRDRDTDRRDRDTGSRKMTLDEYLGRGSRSSRDSSRDRDRDSDRRDRGRGRRW